MNQRLIQLHEYRVGEAVLACAHNRFKRVGEFFQKLQLLFI